MSICVTPASGVTLSYSLMGTGWSRK